MTMRAAAADILQAGVRIEPEEAVAIAQQLIATFRSTLCAEVVEPPFGPPTPDRVVLCDDGSVICRGCETTPAVSEIAALLQALLPPAPARVPGGLRYTIARAQLDVDVAPFDSIDDLSETLARYERGARNQLVIRLLQRFAASRALVPAAVVERRRLVHATDLRRALREADARLYLQHRAAFAEPRGVVTVTPRPPRGRSLAASLACVAAGALLMMTGEHMHRLHTAGALPPVAPPTAAVEPLAPLPPAASADAATVAVQRVGTRQASRVEPRRALQTTARTTTIPRTTSQTKVKRTTAPKPRVYPEPSPRRNGREGVLDRLRLRWLRSVFTSADL